MLQLSPATAPPYLATTPFAAHSLITPLSGGVANVVLKCTDPKTLHSIVLKQPLPQFKTHTQWLVDIDRALVEHDAALLLKNILPPGSVPDVLFFDKENYILALAAAPDDALIWKAALLEGKTSTDAAILAGTLLALLHSHTLDDPAVRDRYADPKFFTQQRTDPYLLHTAAAHPDLAPLLTTLANKLLTTQRTLIHGDYSPKNIFLVPGPPAETTSLMLLDFEVAFFGHPAFDVATLLNHLLLKAHLRLPEPPAPFLEMADAFWQTYRHTADPDVVRLVSAHAGHLLGALLLARIDGKSPAEYLLPNPDRQAQVRSLAKDILSRNDPTLDAALTRAGAHLSPQN